MAETPLVSILIPCYNAERWVGEAIESALAQTYAHTEVIVVDDGSTDGSWKVIQSYGNRVRAETGENRGGNPTRNRLLELSKGEWLQYLDADDYLKPTKVADQMADILAQPEVDVLFGPSIFAHHHGDQPPQESVHPIPLPHDPWVLLARWYLPQTGSPLWRKAALQEVGGWKPDQPCCQEHELYLRLLQAGKRFRYSEHSGSVYRHWSEATVSKRKIALVHEKRLEIEDRAEAFLKERGQLTPERQAAISQARFEVARSRWQYDPDGAVNLVRRLHDQDPQFVPSGDAAPGMFRAIYQRLGYRWAERLAEWKRRGLGR